MRSPARLLFVVIGASALAPAAHAQGYLVAAVASAASPGCQDSEQVPLVAQPAASASASCATTASASASAHSDLATAMVELDLEAAGLGSNAGGQPQLQDSFRFQAPPGLLAPNEPLLVGVTFRLDGSVDASAVAAGAAFASFSVIDSFSPANPNGVFVANQTIDTAFTGPVDSMGTIEVRQPFLEAQLTMSLVHFQGINAGHVDLIGSVALDLPPGVTWTSYSGVLLTVPEATPVAGAGAAAVAIAAMFRSRRGRATKRRR
jgi:hypothetical protein